MLVLARPDYVAWCLSVVYPDEKLQRVQDGMEQLIRLFDERPIHAGCANCGGQATRACAAGVDLSALTWLCDDCMAPSEGYAAGPVGMIRTYKEALEHADRHCHGDRLAVRGLIKAIARAKGYDEEEGPEGFQTFFHPAGERLEASLNA
jgi:hypothetical protein